MGSIFNEKNVGGINGGDKHVKKGKGRRRLVVQLHHFFLHQFYLMQLLHHHLRK
jgi:hypothetical protein